MDIVQITAIIASAFIFIVIIELIRRGRLKERYSLMWLATALVLIVFSLWRPLLHYIALTMGIHYPPSFLFLLAFIFLLLFLLHFSIFISSLSEKNKRLAQEIGMLKTRLINLENRGGREKGTDTGAE